jgi:hypothetical protein
LKNAIKLFLAGKNITGKEQKTEQRNVIFMTKYKPIGI